MFNGIKESGLLSFFFKMPFFFSYEKVVEIKQYLPACGKELILDWNV